MIESYLILMDRNITRPQPLKKKNIIFSLLKSSIRVKLLN